MWLTRLHNLLCTGIVVAVLIYFSILFNLDFLNPIQQTIQDFYYSDFVFSKMRNYNEIPPDTNVVIVNIGSNRAEIARQIEVISQYEPCSIAIDAFFSREKSAELDSALELALSKAHNVILASLLIEYNDSTKCFDSISVSLPRFMQYCTDGYANFYIDTSNDFRTARRIFPKANTCSGQKRMLGLEAARYYDSLAVDQFIGRDNDFETINFRRNIDKYTVFERDQTLFPNPALEALRGKIVLVGILGPDSRTLVTEDVFYTPMNKRFIGRSYPDMYGVVVHANIISMILDSRWGSSYYIDTLPDGWSNALVIVSIYAIMALYSYIRRKNEEWYELLSNLTTLIGFVVVFITIIYALHWFNYEIQVPALFFGIMISTLVFELYHDSLIPLAVSGVKKIRSIAKKDK